jgi:uncharacterized damage-inducible protein DinB
MTTATDDLLASAIALEASDELQQALKRIEHCLKQLNDDQVWWRPDEFQNSIGNLILHLCGNLRQWAVSGLGGAKDLRNRPQEFSERGPVPKNDLLASLKTVVTESADAFSKMTASEWLRIRRIQSVEVTGVGALLRTVPHFRGHTQEIIFRTRCLLGQKYEFFWTPKTPEQAASAEESAKLKGTPPL